MNSLDHSPNYKQIYQFVKSRFEQTNHFKHGPFDETFYSMRVYETAKDIIEKLNTHINRPTLLTASILHDIGKTKLQPSQLFSQRDILHSFREEWHKHAQLGVNIAKNYLKKLGHSKEFIDQVTYLIEHHDLRGDKLKHRTLELKVLQDADLISDIGLAGFIKAFLFSGKFKDKSVITAIKYIKENKGNFKPLEKLNLEASKQLAQEEVKTQNYLISQISKEIESDLLS